MVLILRYAVNGAVCRKKLTSILQIEETPEMIIRTDVQIVCIGVRV